MELYISNIIEWFPVKSDDSSRFERVLWIYPDFSGTFVINLKDKNAFPIFRDMMEVQTAVEGGGAQIIKEEIAENCFLTDEEIPEKQKVVRDSRWNVISEIVEKEPDVYDPNLRGRMVQDAMKKFNFTKPFIYKSLKQYWRNGMTKNALLPRYDKCGAAGKERKMSEAKRGRPRKILMVDPDKIGVNVDENSRQRLLLGAKLYFLSETEMTLQRAYRLTLKKFFYNGYRMEGDNKVPIIPDESELPSLGQFKYYIKKYLDVKTVKEARFGKKAFNLRHRAVLGSSTQEALGPGHIFQIDATIADIYSLSRYYRRRIIGRPVIYGIIDVFSRLIVGLYIGLTGPSWEGAAMALENAASDKVAFCARYGIDILPSQWPSRHLPKSIIADRGEMIGDKARNLINCLGVEVKNLPPFRADWKGIVEQYFRICNLSFIKWQPGAVCDIERGDRDYRLDATLDLEDFTKIMILSVLQYNNDRLMEWYPLDKYMLYDEVRPYPVELWNWGLKNRGGFLKQFPQDIVRLNLLPTETATVTHRGIIFNNMRYGCDKAIQDNWFIIARNGTWNVDISYDPRLVNFIYIRDKSGKEYEKCRLLDSETRYRNMRLEEVQDMLAIEEQKATKDKTAILQSEVAFEAKAEAILKQAKKKTNAALDREMSKRERTMQIRDNRKAEKEMDRKSEAWELGKEECSLKDGCGIITEFPSAEQDKDGSTSPNKISLFKRMREEMDANES